MQRWTRFLFFFSFLASSAALAAPKPTPQAAPIRIQIGGEPSTLDPAKIADQYGYGIMRNVAAGLFRLDAETGELKPDLVSDYRMAKDGKSYRFSIRPDARWSDGRTVQAEEFVTALKRALDPATGCFDAAQFFAILNAREIFGHKRPMSDLGVSVKDGELVIELAQPDSQFLSSMALPAAAPIRADLLSANKGVWSPRFPSTGDYTIKSGGVGEKIELVPNRYRTQTAKTGIPSDIIYHILPEEVTALNLFETGRMDVVSTVSLTEIERLRATGTLRFFPSTTVFSLGFNVQKGPAANLALRRAVASIVKRDDIARLLHGVFAPELTIVPSTILPSIVGKEIHDDKAIAQVIAQGRAQKEKTRLRLAFGNSELNRILSEKLQADLKRELGLEIELMPMDLKSLISLLQRDPPDMYLLGMSALYRDLTRHLEAFSTNTGANFSRYDNADFESLIRKIKSSSGPEQAAFVQAANAKVVEEDVVVVPLVMRRQAFAVGKTLKGFQVNPFQVIQLSLLTK